MATPTEEPYKYKFVLLSHKDSDILTLSSAKQMLPLDFPPIETADLCSLKVDNDMLDVINEKIVLDSASTSTSSSNNETEVLIIVRLLGRGVPGFQHLLEHAQKHNHYLIVVSGIPGSFEPDLTAMCNNVSVDTINEVMKYFHADGCANNMGNMLRYLADHVFKFGYEYDPAVSMPDHGLYHPKFDGADDTMSYMQDCFEHSGKPTVVIIFYRCHYLSGNRAFVDALLDELEVLGVNSIGLFTETLRAAEPIDNVNGHAVERFPTALTYLLDQSTGKCMVDIIISSMAFAMGEVNPDGPTLGNWSAEGIKALNVPVLQVINSVGTYDEWKESARGLNPLDTAMNVAIPEFDGRIITLPISFMAPVDETNSVQYYEPVLDRVVQVAKQATKLATLRHKPNSKKRIAFMLTNSSGKAERIGDAVGLDTPASIMKVFEAMIAAGYDFGEDGSLPSDGDELIKNLVDRCSYDEIYLTEHQLANAAGRVATEVYESLFDTLPQKQRDQIIDQWGKPPGEAYVHNDAIALAGLEFGNTFMALQPPRGYGMDPDKIYHTPDLPPPHNYFALYRWLRNVWKADAIVHMGKHGTLEWLPGKGVGLSSECYPDTFLDDMPLIYPFIINDPGEGMQSKRRAHSVIIDHLTPPMTTADGYGELAQLMQLVDEYYQIEMLDPKKLPLIQKQIWELIQKINLDEDLSFLLNHDHDHHHESVSAHDEPSEKEKGDCHRHSSHDHDHAHHSCGAHTDAASQAATTTDEPTKAYVHSTFDLSKVLIGLTVDDQNNTANVIKYCLETKLLNGEIKDVTVDVSEQTLSVDHKPHFLTASGIVDVLDNFMYEVSISLDGGADGLRALAHHHSGCSHDEHSDKQDDHCHSSHDHHHQNSDSMHAESSEESVSDHNYVTHDNGHSSGGSHEHSSHSHHSHEHEHNHSHSEAEESNDHNFESVLAKMGGSDFAHLIEDMDGYLCELAGAQIRDGLHILGKVPEGDTMIDMLQALTRLSNLEITSLRGAIAALFGLDASELLENQGLRVQDIPPMLLLLADRPLVTAGDIIETVDELVKHLLALLEQENFKVSAIAKVIGETFPQLEPDAETSDITTTLEFVCTGIVPNLSDTTQEITNLILALDGGFVPAGPSGSPTRGMAHLLPTGRNFYACDPQSLPSLAAWEVGQGLAKTCLDRFLADTGAYPEHVAISVWGTAAMRTHGDDIAEIFSLLGIRPIWQKENHRVTGVELIPLAELGRPRIDVTIRISGFFRDAFPHLITLLDDAVNMALDADEPVEENFIRKHYLEDMENEKGETSSRYRVFGCPPGAYGIGILDLIEAHNWKDEHDFAECYVNWGGYAYSKRSPDGIEAKSEFTHRLTTVEVAIHNQDDREHDIFDSDDYFQFHGGMIATIKALSGKDPKGYFGDSQNPSAPKCRDIKEETLRVYRTRVVNPKWLESIKQHGYKGASEMAATVDYLFGFDATANVVSDFMYEEVAQQYALDKATQEFYEQSNPWALKGISERLLEAAQRGMWVEPDPDTLEALKQTLLKSDAVLEGRSELT